MRRVRRFKKHHFFAGSRKGFHSCQIQCYNITIRMSVMYPPKTVTTKATILFVDDDPVFLELLAEQMKSRYAGKYAVETCTSVGAALVFLKSTHVNLICLDLNMPGVDGIQGLKLIAKKHPTLRKIMLTSMADDAYRQTSLEQGADLYLQKPKTIAEYDSVFLTIDILLDEETGGGIMGTMRRVSMSDLIQMECTSQSSSVCYVKDGEISGRIFICEGEIVHAEFLDLMGFEAFKSMLSMDHGSFDVKPYEEPSHRSIDVRWDYLLLECSRPSTDTPDIPLVEEVVEAASAAQVETSVVPETEPPSISNMIPQSQLESADTEMDCPGLTEMVCIGEDGILKHSFQVTDFESRRSLISGILEHGVTIASSITVPELQRVKTKGIPSLSVIRMVQVPLGDLEYFEVENNATRMMILARGKSHFMARASYEGMPLADMNRLGKRLCPANPLVSK